jgi:hypothetical protein
MIKENCIENVADNLFLGVIPWFLMLFPSAIAVYSLCQKAYGTLDVKLSKMNLYADFDECSN